MKKRFSLTHLLQNDKLMAIVSLILAILVWALVVYGPSNEDERVISGVPISVTLDGYATQTLNLRISNNGQQPTATVRVRGLRSVVSRLTASDITVTADTSKVIKEGTYTLPLHVVSGGDYSILDVVGPDGSSDTITITCDVWDEKPCEVKVEMPNLKVADDAQYQMGTPVVSSAVLRDGAIIVTGPRSDVSRVNKVVAVISNEQTLSETAVFTATLEARDSNGDVIDSILFVNAEDGKVNVTVPVMVYRELSLTPTLLHVPEGYASMANLVTVSPSKLAVWGVPSELDGYVADLQKKLTVDFDHLDTASLSREIVLAQNDGVQPVDNKESIRLSVQLSGIGRKRFDLPMDSSTVTFINTPSDMTATIKQTKLSVVLCGPINSLEKVQMSDLRVQVDLSQSTGGLQTVSARITVSNHNDVWARYEDGKNGAELLVSLN